MNKIKILLSLLIVLFVACCITGAVLLGLTFTNFDAIPLAVSLIILGSVGIVISLVSLCGELCKEEYKGISK